MSTEDRAERARASWAGPSAPPALTCKGGPPGVTVTLRLQGPNVVSQGEPRGTGEGPPGVRRVRLPGRSSAECRGLRCTCCSRLATPPRRSEDRLAPGAHTAPARPALPTPWSCSQAALNATGTELCAPLTYLLRVSLDAEHRAPTRRDRRATRQLCSRRDGTGGASRTSPASCRGLPCAPPRQ